MVINFDWTAVAAISAAVAALFAGLSYLNIKRIQKYVDVKEAPELWMVKDEFVYEDYEITDLTNLETAF